MMASFRSTTGKTLSDGDKATLVLRPGLDPDTGEEVERAQKGVIRSFKDDQGETRWEIGTDSEQWPAIGFDPKTAEFK